MGEVYRIRGDSTGAVKSIGDLTKAIQAADKATDAAAKTSKRLDDQAQRIKEAVDPQERYNRKIRELAEHVKANRLSLEQAQTAARKYGQDLENAGRKGDNVFGSHIRNAAALVTGMFTISRAVSAVADAYRKMDEAAKTSVAQSFAALNAAGELQQLAEDPEQFRALLAESRGLIRRGIVRPAESVKAFETVFNLQSAGFGAESREALFIAAQRKQIADIQGVGTKLQSLQDIFGAEDTGSIKQTLDKMSAVSKNTAENITQTAQQFPKFATEAVALQIDFATAGAAYVATRKQSSSASIAANRVRAFFDQLDSGGLYTGDLESSINAISARVDAGEKLSDILGSTRARAGFRALATTTGQQLFDQAYADITGSEGFLESRQFVASDPRLRALAVLEAEGGSTADLVGEKLEEQQALVTAVRAARDRYRTQKIAESGDIGALLLNAQFGVGYLKEVARDFLGGNLERTLLRQALIDDELGERRGGLLLPESRATIKDYLRRIEQNQRSSVTTVPE